jgi:hypothetical protein
MNMTTSEDTTNVPSTPAAQAEAASKPKKASKPKAKKASVKKSATKAEKKAKGKKKAKDGVPEGPAALKRYAPEYHKDNEKKTAGGNTSVDNDDDVAKKLRGKDLDEVYTFAAKTCELSVAELKKKYGGLNPGMQRMNLGNKIRGVLHAK